MNKRLCNMYSQNASQVPGPKKTRTLSNPDPPSENQEPIDQNKINVGKNRTHFNKTGNHNEKTRPFSKPGPIL